MWIERIFKGVNLMITRNEWNGDPTDTLQGLFGKDENQRLVVHLLGIPFELLSQRFATHDTSQQTRRRSRIRLYQEEEMVF